MFTLFEIVIFCPKIQLWFSEKIVDFYGVKNSWKCCGFGLFSCWQLWFHEKNCRFFWVKNSWKCCGFGLFSSWQLCFHEKNCQKKNWAKNSWKCWGFVKIEFLDKNLTFRIVWSNKRIIRPWDEEFWENQFATTFYFGLFWVLTFENKAFQNAELLITSDTSRRTFSVNCV